MYKDFHECDYSEIKILHKNYLGKLVDIYTPMECVRISVMGAKVVDEENFSLTSYGILENGHFSIKVWSGSPSEINFNLFLETDSFDPDLILDNFCAPAVPCDGMGMFDYSFSINTVRTPMNKLQKSKFEGSAYHINDPVSIKNDKEQSWSITLNRLKEQECYFCKNTPIHWIFVNDNLRNHPNFISVLACENHISLGRIRELSFSLEENDELDYCVSRNNEFELKSYKSINTEVTKNIKKN